MGIVVVAEESTPHFKCNVNFYPVIQNCILRSWHLTVTFIQRPEVLICVHNIWAITFLLLSKDFFSDHKSEGVV